METVWHAVQLVQLVQVIQILVHLAQLVRHLSDLHATLALPVQLIARHAVCQMIKITVHHVTMDIMFQAVLASLVNLPA